jgi:serine/threonine protein kinase
VLDCQSDSGPVSVPSSLINLWTSDFKNELYCGSSSSLYSGLVFADKQGAGERAGAGRRVAVKKIKSESIVATSATVSLGESTSAERLIRREIDVQSCFHHANIIRLLAYYLPSSEDLQASEEIMKELSLVYEYAPLGGLDALLRDDVGAGKMKWQGRLKIATGVAKGLCCMHYSVTDSPAYHGDIRSGNIVLMDDYTPKITGLGSCKYTVDFSSQDSSIQPESSHQSGTAEYMCPAYSSGEIGEYDAKCEVFSYGIVLLELLTGQLQGSLGEDCERLMLDKCLAENRGLLADRRVEWPQGVVDDVVMLARECVAPYQRRIGSMMTVMRRMEAMSNKQYTSNTAELELLEENDTLLARLAALQLLLDINTKKATEPTYTCMSCNDSNIPRSKGVFCSSSACPHFFCGSERKDCVSKMLSSQFNDITPHLASKSCTIQCACCTAVTPEAVSTFDLSDIASQSSRKAFSAYMNAVVGLERHEAALATEELRSHFASEMQIHSKLYLKDTTPVQ